VCEKAFLDAVAADDILVTLRNLPLAEEGIYSFGISLGADPPVTITVPVLLMSRPAHVRVHYSLL